jgi:hypothetical protein
VGGGCISPCEAFASCASCAAAPSCAWCPTPPPRCFATLDLPDACFNPTPSFSSLCDFNLNWFAAAAITMWILVFMSALKCTLSARAVRGLASAAALDAALLADERRLHLPPPPCFLNPAVTLTRIHAVAVMMGGLSAAAAVGAIVSPATRLSLPPVAYAQLLGGSMSGLLVAAAVEGLYLALLTLRVGRISSAESRVGLLQGMLRDGFDRFDGGGGSSAGVEGDRVDEAEMGGRGVGFEEVRERSDSAFEITNCSICLDRRTNTALIPCGHLICYGCSKALRGGVDKCPICRRNVQGVLNLFNG